MLSFFNYEKKKKKKYKSVLNVMLWYSIWVWLNMKKKERKKVLQSY